MALTFCQPVQNKKWRFPFTLKYKIILKEKLHYY